jgi:hypothetical protein
MTSERSLGLVVTNHFRDRLRERYPDVSIDQMLKCAVVAGDSLRRHLRDMPSASVSTYMCSEVGRHFIVFVIANGHLITVLPPNVKYPSMHYGCNRFKIEKGAKSSDPWALFSEKEFRENVKFSRRDRRRNVKARRRRRG